MVVFLLYKCVSNSVCLLQTFHPFIATGCKQTVESIHASLSCYQSVEVPANAYKLYMTDIKFYNSCAANRNRDG